MTDEELEKKAEESYAKRLKDSSYYETGEEGAYICSYIAGVKELQEETLREIIEVERVSDYRWEENQQLKQENEQLKKQIKDLESQLKDAIKDSGYYQYMLKEWNLL